MTSYKPNNKRRVHACMNDMRVNIHACKYTRNSKVTTSDISFSNVHCAALPPRLHESLRGTWGSHKSNWIIKLTTDIADVGAVVEGVALHRQDDGQE